MSQYYNSARSQFLPDSMYKSPIDLMKLVLKKKQAAQQDFFTKSELFQGAIDDISHLNFKADNDRVLEKQNYYNGKVDNLTKKMRNDPVNYQKYLPELRQLQRELIQDKKSGELFHIENRYNKRQQWLKDNKKIKESSPDLYNRINNYWNSDIIGRATEDSEAAFNGQQIIERPELIQAYRKVFENLKASATEITPDGTYIINNTEVTEDQVAQMAHNTLMAHPDFKGYVSQMGSLLGDSGFFTKDEEGNTTGGVPAFIYLDRESNILSPEDFSSLSAKDAGEVVRVLNPEYAFYNDLASVTGTYSNKEQKIRENKFGLQERGSKLKIAEDNNKNLNAQSLITLRNQYDEIEGQQKYVRDLALKTLDHEAKARLKALDADLSLKLEQIGIEGAQVEEQLKQNNKVELLKYKQNFGERDKYLDYSYGNSEAHRDHGFDKVIKRITAENQAARDAKKHEAQKLLEDHKNKHRRSAADKKFERDVKKMGVSQSQKKEIIGIKEEVDNRKSQRDYKEAFNLQGSRLAHKKNAATTKYNRDVKLAKYKSDLKRGDAAAQFENKKNYEAWKQKNIKSKSSGKSNNKGSKGGSVDGTLYMDTNERMYEQKDFQNLIPEYNNYSKLVDEKTKELSELDPNSPQYDFKRKELTDAKRDLADSYGLITERDSDWDAHVRKKRPDLVHLLDDLTFEEALTLKNQKSKRTFDKNGMPNNPMSTLTHSDERALRDLAETFNEDWSKARANSAVYKNNNIITAVESVGEKNEWRSFGKAAMGVSNVNNTVFKQNGKEVKSLELKNPGWGSDSHIGGLDEIRAITGAESNEEIFEQKAIRKNDDGSFVVTGRFTEEAAQHIDGYNGQDIELHLSGTNMNKRIDEFAKGTDAANSDMFLNQTNPDYLHYYNRLNRGFTRPPDELSKDPNSYSPISMTTYNSQTDEQTSWEVEFSDPTNKVYTLHNLSNGNSTSYFIDKDGKQYKITSKEQIARILSEMNK